MQYNTMIRNLYNWAVEEGIEWFASGAEANRERCVYETQEEFDSEMDYYSLRVEWLAMIEDLCREVWPSCVFSPYPNERDDGDLDFDTIYDGDDVLDWDDYEVEWKAFWHGATDVYFRPMVLSPNDPHNTNPF